MNLMGYEEAFQTTFHAHCIITRKVV